MLTIAPEWATEHSEHSWLGNLESSAWTCTAWANPLKATSKTPARARNLTVAEMRFVRMRNMRCNATSTLYRLPGTKNDRKIDAIDGEEAARGGVTFV